MNTPLGVSIRKEKTMLFHTIYFMLASMAVGYVLYLIFYWRQMHALVPFIYGNLDAPHIMLILAIVGLVLSLL